MKRYLVCGGRDYRDRVKVFAVLDDLMIEQGRFVVVQGGADGADALAMEWALAHGCPVWTFPADWPTHGKKAGHIRNAEMLAIATPTAVIAFSGGRGTADMIRRAEDAGLKVYLPT